MFRKTKENDAHDDVMNPEAPENSVEQVSENDANQRNDVPTVNSSGRDAGNSKSLKVMSVLVLGLVVILIGLAMSVGRFQQSKAEEKAKEAEKLAQEQKTLASSSKVDIEADKEALRMQQLPPPADANAPASDAVATQATVADDADDFEQPAPKPKQREFQPQYTNYDSDAMVAGRDYAPPAPVQQPVAPSISSFSDDEDDEPKQPVQVAIAESMKEEHSNVLVDVYGAKAVSNIASSQDTGLGNNLKSSQLANGSASKRGDKSMLLMRGTTIPCVLITKIDSTYQGFTTCQLAKDVYSANGRVLLMERGSKVFGEQNIQMSQGKARVSILWSRVETPKGISVALDSPAVGQLGEMGIGAKVNNHFFKRFSGAIMLSVIQDGFAIARSHLEKRDDSGNTTNVTNTTNTAESMSEEILKNTINIPPTATVNQGTVINIMVARDVDFSKMYEVIGR